MRMALACVLALAACTSGDPRTAVTRQVAKSVVLPVVAQRLPGPQAQAVTTCVIDNATVGDLNALARDVGTRAGTSTVATIAGVLRRPETVRCVLGAGIPGLSV